MKKTTISLPSKTPTVFGIFLLFLKLGCTCFGGPIAHLGYFREEFVLRQKWLTEQSYADLVALSQFLPGPASSQVGIALGLSRAGLKGAIAAWLGFTLPSAIIMLVFAIAMTHLQTANNNWLHGLKVVAVAIVAQALWGMAKILTPDGIRISIALVAAIVTSLIVGILGQLIVMLGGGLLGWWLLTPPTQLPHCSLSVPINKKRGLVCLTLFFLLLFLLPLLALETESYVTTLFAGFYRAGALVFGGGHVVLPLLQTLVVPSGWVTNNQFLAGYGIAQALPGPLFTFAAYLGALSTQTPAGFVGASIALIAIFLPSFLLIIGTLPFWEVLRNHFVIQRAMLGVNAAVVGLLLAAFYNPVWTSAIYNLADYFLAVVCFLLLLFCNIPSWAVVIFAAVVTGLGWP
ncbi:chromate efflux transporter [Legionella sp. 31fI33]|uniref:chromate efflux transporter n=1 Tax=Legionella sp. 31fI33 TaxID=2886376 RepID=UPI001E4E8D8D|nr:chromate efflux transporter [Legionella sp. 31fI33]MCC5014521.1 chromate efflux transporter [Legionella sp. 31fI33]